MRYTVYYLLLAMLSLLASCDKEPAPVCTPLESRVCECQKAAQGVQTCTEEGWGKCENCERADDAPVPAFEDVPEPDKICFPGNASVCSCPSNGKKGIQACAKDGLSWKACSAGCDDDPGGPIAVDENGTADENIDISAENLDEGAADLLIRGTKMAKMGKHAEAIALYEAAHRASPDSGELKKSLAHAYHSLAMTLAKRKMWLDAIQNEERACGYDKANLKYREHLAILLNNYGMDKADNGDFDSARDYLSKALRHDENSKPIRNNLYKVLLNRSKQICKQKCDIKALRLVKEAVSLEPKKIDAYLHAGDIHYNQDEFSDALEQWKSALELSPDNPVLLSKIAKVSKEQLFEDHLAIKSKEFFRIRFQKESGSEYGSKVSVILKEARRKLGQKYNIYPEATISVIVYTSSQFNTVTGAGGAAGLYDGKIRIREHDLSTSRRELESLLFHEYSHALLYLEYGKNIPRWIHEGFAQCNDPSWSLSHAEKALVLSNLEAQGGFRLQALNSMLTRSYGGQTVRTGYILSKLAMDYLFEKIRVQGVTRLFEKLKDSHHWQAALQSIFDDDPMKINSKIGHYIKKKLS